jgi:hypothetical protein
MGTNERGIALVLTFDHPQQVTQNFAREITQGLTSQGFEGRILSMNSELQSQAASIDWNRVRLCVSLGPLPLTILVDRIPLYEFLSCPFIFYSLDSVFYDFQLVPQARSYLTSALNNQRLVIACADEDFVDVLLAYAQFQSAKLNVCFTPFATFTAIPSATAPERQHRALLVGNLGAELSAQFVRSELQETLVANASGIADQIKLSQLAAAILDKEAPQNITKLFVQMLELEPSWILDLPKLHLLAAADSHLKRVRRSYLAQALVESPIPVDIFGTGWERVIASNRQVRMLGSLPHTDLFAVSTAYSHGINLDPNWGRGFHDRVFTFLSAGMQVLSNSNTFIDRLSPEGKNKVRSFNVMQSDSVQAGLASGSIHNLVPWSWRDLKSVEDHQWNHRCNSWLTRLG